VRGKPAIVVGILLTILSLIIGLIGIGVLIGIGEAANNSLIAYAAISFPYALLAGFFAWIVPGARWAIAGAMSIPVALLSLAGAWSGGFLLQGAIWTVAITFGGAYIGGRLRVSRSGSQPAPPASPSGGPRR
jgi:hypothetical protein